MGREVRLDFYHSIVLLTFENLASYSSAHGYRVETTWRLGLLYGSCGDDLKIEGLLLRLPQGIWSWRPCPS